MINKLPRSISVEGVQIDLSPEQYDTFGRLAGGDYMPLAEMGLIDKKEASKMSKQDLHGDLLAVVDSEEYKISTNKTQKALIKERINFRRQAAKEFLFQLYPEIQLKQQIGTLEQMKASTPDIQMKEAIEGQKQQLIRTKGTPKL